MSRKFTVFTVLVLSILLGISLLLVRAIEGPGPLGRSFRYHYWRKAGLIDESIQTYRLPGARATVRKPPGWVFDETSEGFSLRRYDPEDPGCISVVGRLARD